MGRRLSSTIVSALFLGSCGNDIDLGRLHGIGVATSPVTSTGAQEPGDAHSSPFDYCRAPQRIVTAPGFDCSHPPGNVVCVNPGDVTDLYNQVNNPGNAGKIVYVPAGQYLLNTANTATWNIYQGALVLPEGTSVVGANAPVYDANGVPIGVLGTTCAGGANSGQLCLKDSDCPSSSCVHGGETIIDGSSTLFAPGLADSPICNGPNFNNVFTAPVVHVITKGCLANVTVRDSFNVFNFVIRLGGASVAPASVPPENVPVGGWHASLSDSIATGSAVVAISVGTGGGCSETGLDSGFTILRNIANIDGAEDLDVSQGGPGGSRVRARVEKNRFLGTPGLTEMALWGCRGLASGATTMVHSLGNIVDGGSRGLSVVGGLTYAFPVQANSDAVCLVSSHDQISNNARNGGTPGVLMIGGALGGFHDGSLWTGPINHDSLVRAYFSGTKFINNRRDGSFGVDFGVIGADGDSSQPNASAGDRNRAELALFSDVSATENDYNTDGTLKVPAWQPGHSYNVGDPVTNLGNHYQCRTAGTSDGNGGPSGTGSDIIDGTVHWRFYQGYSGFFESQDSPPSSVPDTNRAILLSMQVPFFLRTGLGAASPGSDTGTEFSADDSASICRDLTPFAATNSDPLICRDASGAPTGIAAVPTAPPPFSVNCPSPPSVECTGPAGATATFSATANLGTDGRCDGFPLDCSAVSGDTFALGSTQVSCSLGVNDPRGDCALTVTVRDTTPPSFSGPPMLSDNVLWPPDHRLVPVTVTTAASDLCAGNNVSVTCTAVSNEPDSGCGAGNAAGDVQPPQLTTAFAASQAMTFLLRAERCGTDPTDTGGRVYTITCTASDPSGNVSAPVQASVSVPHSP
jgi:hypothetical protein